MNYFEVNFDGLVGPTHNYSGLSYGNIASQNFADLPSNPKQAALQGLEKMNTLAGLGLKQGIFAPHFRPELSVLRQLGFSGSIEQIITQAAKIAPEVLRSCFSASCMWTANAATVSPSLDSADRKIHFTPANLVDKFHRFIEPQQSSQILQAIFPQSDYFTHHAPLPNHSLFADEGAANHTRLASHYDQAGIQLFVYGRAAGSSIQPTRFPARQTLESCQALARLHQLTPEHALFIQQNPNVIDQGVFHNDVIAVGNNNVLFYHQEAFHQTAQTLERIQEAYSGENPLHFIEVSTHDVSVESAVKTYLFNSQLVTLPNQKTALIAPQECEHHEQVAPYLERLIAAKQGIDQVIFMDLKQSMQNGGGPACLRLRVVMNDAELQAVNPACLLNETNYVQLKAWINRHYRDQLIDRDLADASLYYETLTALDELTQILDLGSIYSFQQ